MTHGVQSDIEFARKLLAADCQDTAICAALCWRGVDAATAASLVEALRQGKFVRPQLPCVPRKSTQRRSRRHSARTHPKEHDEATVATISPISNVPLFIHYDHRPKWRRITKRVFRWAAASLLCAALLCSLIYVSLPACLGAKENADRFNDRNPDWNARLYRWKNDVPDPPSDDLTAKPPLPVSAGK